MRAEYSPAQTKPPSWVSWDHSDAHGSHERLVLPAIDHTVCAGIRDELEQTCTATLCGLHTAMGVNGLVSIIPIQADCRFVLELAKIQQRPDNTPIADLGSVPVDTKERKDQ